MLQFYKPNYKIKDNNLRYLTIDKIQEIIDSGIVVRGKYTNELEAFFEKKYNVKYAIACANATTGLIIALYSSLFKEGEHATTKKIGLPAFTWPSTYWAVWCNAGIPIFYDINIDTWIIEDGDFENVDAIIVVDTFGNQAYLDTDKPVIYDAAHGFDLPDLGNRGIVEVVSLAATKEISGMQGGIILTNDEIIAKKCLEYSKCFGKITEINALVALESKLDYNRNYVVRKRIIDTYRNNIDIPFIEQKPTTSVYSVYSILLDNSETRDKIAEAFRKNDIEVKIYYRPLIHGLPNTDDIYSRIISLPVYEEMESKTKWICEVINEACK